MTLFCTLHPPPRPLLALHILSSTSAIVLSSSSVIANRIGIWYALEHCTPSASTNSFIPSVGSGICVISALGMAVRRLRSLQESDGIAEDVSAIQALLGCVMGASELQALPGSDR
jgi:hypothetical protein